MELTTGNRVMVVRVNGLSLPFSFFYLKSCKEELKGRLDITSDYVPGSLVLQAQTSTQPEEEISKSPISLHDEEHLAGSLSSGHARHKVTNSDHIFKL